MGYGNLTQEKQPKNLLHKLSNTCHFINLDIDKEYYELLSLALEYGMTSQCFWNNDLQEFYCYQVAYINKMSNKAYQQGYYNYVGFSTVIANVFKDKNTPVQEYPKENIFNPFYKQKQNTQQAKQNVAKQNVDWKHIKRFLQQNSKGKEDNK